MSSILALGQTHVLTKSTTGTDPFKYLEVSGPEKVRVLSGPRSSQDRLEDRMSALRALLAEMSEGVPLERVRLYGERNSEQSCKRISSNLALPSVGCKPIEIRPWLLKAWTWIEDPTVLFNKPV